MATRDALSTVSTPKQARSERTLQRLLDAAEELIRKKGHADVSIAEIVRKARSSVGGFYARFRDKDELLRALHERTLTDIRARVEALADPAAWGETALPEIVRACMGALVEQFAERRPLIAAFVSHAAHDPQAWADGIRFRREAVERFAALVLTRRAEIRHPDPERAVEVAVHMVFALMDQQALYGGLHAGGRRLNDHEVAAEIERAFLAYLGVQQQRG